MTFALTQVFSGHGYCRAYLHRFKRATSPACPCGAATQDFRHLLAHCPRFYHDRKEHFDLAAEKGIDPLDIGALLRVTGTPDDPSAEHQPQTNLIHTLNTLITTVIDKLKAFNALSDTPLIA